MYLRSYRNFIGNLNEHFSFFWIFNAVKKFIV
jgi:hypothetical protein